MLIETIGLEDADPESLDSDEISLSDLGGDEEDAENVVPVAGEEDTLSLSDIAADEEALEDDSASDVD